MKENTKTKAYLSAIIYSVITGLSFLFGKTGLQYAHPLDLLAYRFTAAFIAMMIPVLFKLVDLNINKDMLKRIIPMAIFSPVIFFGLQSFGLNLLPSSEAGIFLSISPIFTMILASYVLNEKTTFLQKISIFISVSGVIYIGVMKSSSLDFSSAKGIAFLLISVVSLAIYNVMARNLTKEYSSVELTAVMVIISVIVFNALAIGRHVVRGDIENFIAPLKEISFIVAVIYLGALSTALTSYLSNYTLGKIESYKMSVFTNLATVISILAGVIVLNENIYYYHIIGSALIIAGVIGSNYFGRRDEEIEENKA